MQVSGPLLEWQTKRERAAKGVIVATTCDFHCLHRKHCCSGDKKGLQAAATVALTARSSGWIAPWTGTYGLWCLCMVSGRKKGHAHEEKEAELLMRVSWSTWETVWPMEKGEELIFLHRKNFSSRLVCVYAKGQRKKDTSAQGLS